MKDEKINTPEELMEYMNANILYGFVDSKGKIYTPSDEKNFKMDAETYGNYLVQRD